ncbi:MAG: hypothetical protein GY814_08375 [Gammaproteobacteria bacterium]|nr:hypothetical protein [Gammaproteobacteria bacterium]
MKYLKNEFRIGDAEGGEDAVISTQNLESKLMQIQDEIEQLPASTNTSQRLKLTLDRCYLLLDLERQDEAWNSSNTTLKQALTENLWTRAVESCDIMFQTGNKESIRALAHGIWLAVTFPIDPELSVAMLQHLIDETPDNSDGAAVAAATACYLVDLRAKGEQHEELHFFTSQLMGQVAKRHSQVEEKEIFDFWVERLELNEPGKFLPRLAQVLDVLTEDNWWFDRDQLRDLIPGEA